MPVPPSDPLPRPDLLAGQTLPPAPQQARSRRKREALLEAALALFAEYGYEQATIEAMAQRAGIAVGAFYQHFASKRQLLLILMDRLLREAEALAPPAMSPTDTPMPLVIRYLVEQGLQVDWAYAGAYRAWREAAVMDAEIRAFHLQIEQWLAQRLAALLMLLTHAPGLRPQLHIPELAWLLSLVFWRLAEAPLAEPEMVIETLTEMMYHTLFADE